MSRKGLWEADGHQDDYRTLTCRLCGLALCEYWERRELCTFKREREYWELQMVEYSLGMFARIEREAGLTSPF